MVTIDAMGCQRTIAAQIIDQKADYVFGLKGNQGTLHKDVALLFDERQDGFAGHAVTLHESFEKGHGRLETRRVVATDDLAWLQKDHQWPGMRSVAKVESRRELLVEGKVEEETRYYISSLPGDAKQIGHAVRSHPCLAARSNERRNVLPSTATTPRTATVNRSTQAMKQL